MVKLKSNYLNKLKKFEDAQNIAQSIINGSSSEDPKKILQILNSDELKEIKDLLKPAEMIKKLDKVANSKVYGVLYNYDEILKYFELNGKKNGLETRYRHSRLHYFYAIYNNGKDVYYSGYSNEDLIEKGFYYINSLFLDNPSKRKYKTNSINEYNGIIIDSGRYGLYDTLENKVLISKRAMKKKGIKTIASLIVKDNRLFGICNHFNKKHSLRELTDYSISDVILNYKTEHDSLCQAQILPYNGFKGENEKHYNFSVLSCVNSTHLDLNGDKIKDSEVKNSAILRLEVLDQNGQEVDIIYAGSDLNEIYQAKIDLENKKVIEKKVLVPDTWNLIGALSIVRDEGLHKKLLEESKNFSDITMPALEIIGYSKRKIKKSLEIDTPSAYVRGW